MQEPFFYKINSNEIELTLTTLNTMIQTSSKY